MEVAANVDGPRPDEMRPSTFRLEVDDGSSIFVYRWEPASGTPKAVVQLTHGMAEHAGRYTRLAEALTSAGYALYASDDRGHGRTVERSEDLGWFGERDGFVRMVRDLVAVSDRIAADHPGLPIFLLGHSMGSLLARYYLFEHAGRLAGCVLSGTSGGNTLPALGGRALARVEQLRIGPRGRSKALQVASFGLYNVAFRPVRTQFDWLTRDPAEVDKYIEDPLCGFDLTVQGWLDVLWGVIQTERAGKLAQLPKDLPIYIFSGALDPVGNQTRGVRWLLRAFERAGMRNVSHRFYPEGRHEMFNEVNRDEVQRDLVDWLDAVLAQRAAAA